MCNCINTGRYDECCGRTYRQSDIALAALRRKLAGDYDYPMPDGGVQRESNYNLIVSGPPFAHPSAPDFVVEAAGQSVSNVIAAIIAEAEARIAEALGEAYAVTLREV